MANQENVTIIIPAYNEEEAIETVISSIKNSLNKCKIIVVNDCSTDRTGELAEKTGVIVLHHDVNRGYGASLKTGIRKADTEYVMMCDADGQHRVEDLIKLIDMCDKYDMVVGVRGADSHAPFFRRPGKFILTTFCNYLAGQKIPDFNSGMRIFRRKAIIRYLHLASDRFSFSTTTTFAMLKSNHSIKYCPIKVMERIGSSQVKQLKHGSQTLLLMLRLTVLYEPLKVFLNVTFFFAALSVIFIGLDIMENLKVGRIHGIGTTSLLSIITTFFFFFIGLVCDQVSAIRRELHEKL